METGQLLMRRNLRRVKRCGCLGWSLFLVNGLQLKGNATNPMIGSGVQQTRKRLEGVNRRSGEKTQGRNRIGPLAKADRALVRKRKLHRPRTEWTSSLDADGGAIFGNPMSGAWARPSQDGSEMSSKDTLCGVLALPSMVRQKIWPREGMLNRHFQYQGKANEPGKPSSYSQYS